MKVETVSINKIKPYENNPRNNDDAVDAAANSIKEFGWQQPIVVDNGGVIIAGHTRYKAAKKLGYKEVPIVVADSFDYWQRFNNCEPIVDLHKYK
ncbi:putative transcriptional regulator [Lactobacillus phage KC5a]|uniref:ParB-like partition nuclease n=1 Tax=Lactobacillus phage KC5a TaxID=363555 RepID=UPI00006DE023|nr:ParB-like partition nuclease [Lactobacillus phage KC5a]ABD78806.1 putative transcriptional regulator [Lactobacillus phage KC5a]